MAAVFYDDLSCVTELEHFRLRHSKLTYVLFVIFKALLQRLCDLSIIKQWLTFPKAATMFLCLFENSNPMGGVWGRGWAA